MVKFGFISKKLVLFLFTGLLFGQDWANLNEYTMVNKNLEAPGPNENRVVFMGNSITEGWSTFLPEFFSGKDYVNRGISGQTTPQMLIRFRPDVIDLRPSAVVILAGINDIAENTGPSTVKMITDNIVSMAELAESNGIMVILSSILPANDFTWNSGLNPPSKILAINAFLKNYAVNKGMSYIDYYSAMVDDQEGLKKEYGEDGVHPNKKGYEVMSILVERAISETLDLKIR